ncbi:MAG: DUF2586 family protein [Prevotellaceae bacterium]|jgi:hypothetical protein|nr:DUF2586 family protein [Prevotellaceae bacterium]
MSFQGVRINKINGGLGGAENPDRVAVMVVGAGAIGDTLAVNAAYKLLQLADAETLGITAERDTADNRLDHYHLSEIFRLAPESVVWLISVPGVTKVSDLKNQADFLAAIRGIEGVNLIAEAGMANEVAAGETSALAQAVTGAQLLVDALKADHIYIDAFLVEGKGGYLPAASAAISTYEDLRELDSPNVSVIIGQDYGVSILVPPNPNHACVGSAVGMLLVRAVHENLGSVDIESKPSIRKGESDYTLTDTKLAKFVIASLSNGRSFSTLSIADQKQLDLFGYIYVGAFAGYAGFFFSNSHTCEEQDSDYCFIERNCVWNKAARIIRRTLIPRVRSKVEANPSTGYIKETTITDWDGRVRKALDPMRADGNVSGFDIFIDPKQAAVSVSPFKINVKLVANGVVHEFDVDLGFTNKI